MSFSLYTLIIISCSYNYICDSRRDICKIMLVFLLIISTLWMSIYSNVTEEDVITLRKLAEQQKNQRALRSKNRIWKQTHDITLAASFFHNTKNLDTNNETTKQLAEVIEKSQPENIIPQPAIEHTPPPQPIENNEGVIYDTKLENTRKIMTNNTGFFQTYEDQ